MAKERLSEAMAKARHEAINPPTNRSTMWANLTRRERKTPYNGADGVPIREEVVAKNGEAVLTRNSYGALCLNTSEVLFIDVDNEQLVSPPLVLVLAKHDYRWRSRRGSNFVFHGSA